MQAGDKEQVISRAVWEKYQSNLFRHLMVVGRFAEDSLVHALGKNGYKNLSIPFADQMVLIARDSKGIRITELAALQGISKQLCYQSLRPIEKAGYIFRDDDPTDGRAKLVKLTPIAGEMVKEALKELVSISMIFSEMIGAENLALLNRHISKITPMFLRSTKTGFQNFLQSDTIFTASAGQVSRHFETELMSLNYVKGHHNLRHSFSRILAYINLNGSQIKTIAEINGVSYQAIVRITTELEKLGYVSRTGSQLPQRSKRIVFTKSGFQLINDSVDSVISLETELKNILGEKPYNKFCAILKDLYEKIRIDGQVVEDYDPELINIGGVADNHRPAQNKLKLPELLLYIAALCEDAADINTSTGKFTKKLPRKTNDASSPVTFAFGSSRIMGNTAIQTENVMEKIKECLGDKGTATLISQFEKLVSDMDI